MIRQRILALVAPVELGPDSPLVRLSDNISMPISVKHLENAVTVDDMGKSILEMLDIVPVEEIFHNGKYIAKGSNGKPKIFAEESRHILEDTSRIGLGLSRKVPGLVENITVRRPSGIEDGIMQTTTIHLQKHPSMSDVYHVSPPRGAMQILHPNERMHPKESLRYVAQALGATSL